MPYRRHRIGRRLVQWVVATAFWLLLANGWAAWAQQALAITSVSTTAPVPLTPLYIGTQGFDPGSPITVQVFTTAGFSVIEKPIRIASGGTIVAPVPLYVDPVTGRIGPGSVSLVLKQGSRATSSLAISIQDLPPLSSYGTQLGQVSRVVLDLNVMLVARRLNQLQALQLLLGHPADPLRQPIRPPRSRRRADTVDTSKAQAALKRLLSALVQARIDVNRVAKYPSTTIPAGVLPDGTAPSFDATSLDLMDRINAVFLSQTFGALVAPTSATRQNPAAREEQFYNSTAYQNVRPLIDVLSNIHTWEASGAITSSAAAFARARASGDPTMTRIADEAAAVAGGVASLAGSLKFLRTEAANSQLGAVGAAISDVHTVGNAFGDIFAFIYAVRTGNQDLVNTVVQEVNASKSEMRLALADLAATFLPAKLVGPFASTIVSFIEAGADIDKTLEPVDATQDLIENSFPVSPVSTLGIAYVTGRADPRDAFLAGLQYGVSLSSNGITLNTATDPNGDFQLFVPIQASAFDYVRADVQIVDPVSGVVLGSQEIDLSRMRLGTSLPIPPIAAAYPGRPASYDPASCDSTVQRWTDVIQKDIAETQASIADLLSRFSADTAAQTINLLLRILNGAVQDALGSEAFWLSDGGCWEQLATAPRMSSPAWP
ncbi:MAG TPA: hypothetical protein VEU11_05830 [Terriglobales bacterium]|nr:hypothetical protein [Terriglobales bacterium]